MLILTNQNKAVDLDVLTNNITEDIRFTVFDYSKPDEADWYMNRSLIFLEQFTDLALQYRIGDYVIKIPSEFSIVLGDKDVGEIGLINSKDADKRGFQAFTYNPLRSILPEFRDIVLEDIFPNVNWTMPKLEKHHFLAVPLHSGPNPECILLINEKDQKKIPDLELTDFL